MMPTKRSRLQGRSHVDRLRDVHLLQSAFHQQRGGRRERVLGLWRGSLLGMRALDPHLQGRGRRSPADQPLHPSDVLRRFRVLARFLLSLPMLSQVVKTKLLWDAKCPEPVR